MELNNIDHSSSDGAPTFRASIILYISSVVFYIFQTMDLNIVWTWVWRALSLISLILIIYINWNKALEIFKSKKKKDK
jgi:hypothetical protein